MIPARQLARLAALVDLVACALAGREATVLRGLWRAFLDPPGFRRPSPPSPAAEAVQPAQAWRNYYADGDGNVWPGMTFDNEDRARWNAAKVGRGDSSRPAYRVRIRFKPGVDPGQVLGGLLVEGPAPADLVD